MSASPKPPRPVEWNSNQCPSREKLGALSSPLLLRAGPRFAGWPHASSRLARRDTQRSSPPWPPGRSELKYRLRPSLEIAGRSSPEGELATGPRLTGVPHGPNVLGSDRSSRASMVNMVDAPVGNRSAVRGEPSRARRPSAQARLDSVSGIGEVRHVRAVWMLACFRREGGRRIRMTLLCQVGLRENENAMAPSAQTERRGEARPRRREARLAARPQGPIASGTSCTWYIHESLPRTPAGRKTTPGAAAREKQRERPWQRRRRSSNRGGRG